MSLSLYAFGGLSGHGKDTAAEYLAVHHKYLRLAFANRVRTILYQINPMIDGEPLTTLVRKMGWPEVQSYYSEVRRMLQSLGHGARINLGMDVWVKPIREEIENAHFNKIVVTDVRYPNELDMLHELGATSIYVSRPSVGRSEVHEHPSENQVTPSMFNYEIINQTIPGLRKDLKAIMSETTKYQLVIGEAQGV